MKGATKVTGLSTDTIQISIHAPYEGSDGIGGDADPQLFRFQSTLPMKGATKPTGALP